MNINFFEMVAVRAGFVAFALAMGLVACGDDGSTNGPSNGHNDSSASFVESEDDLPNCTESRDGSVSFVDGTKEGFVCKDRKWLHYDMLADIEENLPGCAGSREGLTAYLYEENRELKCVEGAWGAVGEEAGSSSSVFPSSSSSVIPGTAPESGSSSVKYGSLTDSRDGQTYKTVTIGTQTWMAENLNYAYKGVKFNYSGYPSDSTSWCYDNLASNCDKYGRLYTWSAVMDSAAQFRVNVGTQCGYGKTCTPNSPHRGICPEGWHVPTNEEYSTLYTYIDGFSTAGSLLRSTSGWFNGGNGSDMYGFSVLPAGDRYRNGNFGGEGLNANLWSASEYDSYYARYQGFALNCDYAGQGCINKYYGRSLRCLKDS